MLDAIHPIRFTRSIAILSLLAGCGGRPASVGVEGQPGAPPAQPPAESSPAIDPASGGGEAAAPAPPDGCVIALRLDVCCPIPEPADASAVGADPCLVPYPYDFNSSSIPAECTARRPRICDDGCGPLNKRPASIFTRRDAETGGCVFVDECATDADCQLAADARFCCLCTDAWPVAHVAAEGCVYPTDAPADPSLAPAACRPAECDDDGGCVGCATAGFSARPWEAFCLTPRGGSPRQCAVH